ncbi:Rrf2 family transcriptional regulator [Candidatus Amesbacteria bacterium]|nr:Rrf2 family transcriptional regulator [Candidatus Amesbacteria bacterium]MBI5412533.1 Rrf2 family transcriptional regulator [Candidatus Peregrinibacteria bacterium]
MAYLGQISTKEHHGLQLILQLAKTYGTKKSVSLRAIGGRERVSAKYLEQLIVPFRKAKWLQSYRGREGGYRMVKDPKTISLKDVMALMGGDRELVSCLGNKRCLVEKFCPSKKAWQTIQDALQNALESIHLSDLLST